MTFVLFVLFIACVMLLLIVAAVQPMRSRFSPFELARRMDSKKEGTHLDASRESGFDDIVSLQRIVTSLLLVFITLLAVVVFGWFVGIIVAVVLSLEYAKLASIGVIRTNVSKLYLSYETRVLDFVAAQHGAIRWVSSIVPKQGAMRVDSREELIEIVSSSEGVLSDDEKNFISSSLGFDGRTVEEIMTPKSVVDTIKNTEILGPLVLDDLHKTGHSRFPVINEDIDHIVGILYVRDVLTLDTSKKHSAKAETAMSKQVYYIRNDHTLDQALSAFLKTHHHMFIVINEYRETVGIVTLEDTLEALLSRKIIDEFDAHDDMRAVATRNASKKSAPNRSEYSKDIN